MKYSIGLDIGITSVGFAVMELDESDIPCRIAKIGSRIFDAPENPKDGASLALPRREARGIRRRTRRRKHRKERIKSLIVSQSLLLHKELENLYSFKKGTNPEDTDVYKLRVDALDRLLTNRELARVLIHLSQRRGFKSNRKNEAEPKDSKGLLKALDVNSVELSEKYRTVGEMLYNRENRRNKPNDYSNTVQRADILNEAHMIFESQRNFGNNICGEDLEKQYCEILTSQRSFEEGPGGDSPYKVNFQDMVGYCTHEKKEKRAAKATYSFELFNLLQKVNHIRIDEGGKSRVLYANERQLIIDKAHNSPAKLTIVQIIKTLGLSEDAHLNYREFTPLQAYHEMRKALKGVTDMKYISADTRNKIGHIFTYEKTDAKIREKLSDKNYLNLTAYEIETLIKNMKSFNGNGHLSVKALNNIIPHLEQGKNYNEACEKAGYEFKANNGIRICEQKCPHHGNCADKKELICLRHLAVETENTITSPVARRALSQCAKVINAIIREMGTSPVYINIELAREMSNNFDERTKIDKEMRANQDKNEQIKKEILETFCKGNPTGLDIVKRKLFKEQGGECPYCRKTLHENDVYNDIGHSEIDHIVPYSKSFDDSYKNKVLVHSKCNQHKGNRLPLQCFTGKDKDDFIVYVNNSHLSKNKKQNLLREEIPEGFKERNLQDTKTITSFMYNYLSANLAFSNFSTDRKCHVTAVNGAVTSMLRKRWGLNKSREDGDLHHALDAAVVACVTQGNISMLTKLEKYYNNKENFKIDKKTGEVKERFPQPYDYGSKMTFSNELEAWLSNNPKERLRELNYPTYCYQTLEKIRPVFVSRMPNRKVSGAAHKETIKGIGENNSQIKKVTLSSLKLNKDGEIDGYYNPNDDRLLYNALKERLTEYGGKGEKAFVQSYYKPKSDGTQGPLVKKVKIVEKSTLNVLVHDKTGSADNGSMIRVDVFFVEGEGYYLVPIYVADVVKGKLPNKAMPSKKEMKADNFLFSLYSNDLIYVEHKKGMNFVIPKKKKEKSKLDPNPPIQKSEFVYYRSADIDGGKIKIIKHDNSYETRIGIKGLQKFEKWQVDILGNISKVGNEPRLGFDKEG